MRGLVLDKAWLSFYIKPADGYQLPKIMQWLKQTSSRPPWSLWMAVERVSVMWVPLWMGTDQPGGLAETVAVLNEKQTFTVPPARRGLT
jgi:hypothetical protein